MGNLAKLKQVERTEHQTCCASRDGNNQPPQALRREDGLPTNDRPFLAGFDGEIYSLSCGDRDQDPANASWVFQVQVNGAVVKNLTKPVAQSEITLQLGTVVDPVISVNANDRISLWMISQNQRIRDPSGQVLIRRRRT